MKLTGRIVFSSGKIGDFDIWTMNLDTGEMAQLTRGVSCNESPRWSPDGKSIAYISNKDGVPQVWVMNSDGQDQRCITPEKKYHADPSWSPDGKHLIFVGNYEENPDEVEIYQVAVAAPTKPAKILSYPGWELGPSWSPDGRTLLFSSTRAGNEDIWEYGLESKEWRQITSHPARDYAPCYSPDGKWIAFISEADENSSEDKKADGEVWIVSRDLSSERCLTQNSSADRYVTWSPDSKYVMCCSSSTFRRAYRFRFIDITSDSVHNLKYDRECLEKEIGADVTYKGNIFAVLFGSIIPGYDKLYYPSSYFGTEQSPHWTR